MPSRYAGCPVETGPLQAAVVLTQALLELVAGELAPAPAAARLPCARRGSIGLILQLSLMC